MALPFQEIFILLTLKTVIFIHISLQNSRVHVYYISDFYPIRRFAIKDILEEFLGSYDIVVIKTVWKFLHKTG